LAVVSSTGPRAALDLNGAVAGLSLNASPNLAGRDPAIAGAEERLTHMASLDRSVARPRFEDESVRNLDIEGDAH